MSKPVRSFLRFRSQQFELDHFVLKNFGISPGYSIDIQFIQPMRDWIPQESLVEVIWGEHRVLGIVVEGDLSTLHLRSPLEVSGKPRTRYFQNHSGTEILHAFLESYRGEYELEHWDKVLSFDQHQETDYQSLLRLLAEQNGMCLWTTRSRPALRLVREFLPSQPTSIQFAKYGIETLGDHSVIRWRELAKENILELDTRCWLGEIGELLHHPHRGALPIIRIDAKISRESGPQFTFTVCEPVAKARKAHPKYLPLKFSRLIRFQNGEYSLQPLESEGGSYTCVMTQTLASHRWNFPYAEQEIVLQQYAEPHRLPILAGSVISGPLKTQHGFKTSSGNLWTVDESAGISFETSAHRFQFSDSRIQFMADALTRSAAHDQVIQSNEFKIHTQHTQTQEQENFLLQTKQLRFLSAQHLYLTHQNMDVKISGNATWSISKQALIETTHAIHQTSNRLNFKGNFVCQSKQIHLKSPTFRCIVGESQLTLSTE